MISCSSVPAALYRLWLFDSQLGWYLSPGTPKTLADWAELEYALDGVYSFVPAASMRDNVTPSHAGVVS